MSVNRLFVSSDSSVIGSEEEKSDTLYLSHPSLSTALAKDNINDNWLSRSHDESFLHYTLRN